MQPVELILFHKFSLMLIFIVGSHCMHMLIIDMLIIHRRMHMLIIDMLIIHRMHMLIMRTCISIYLF